MNTLDVSPTEFPNGAVGVLLGTISVDMVLQSDDPKTLKKMAMSVKTLVKEHIWPIKSEATAAFCICSECHDLADRPPADARRMAAVELLRDLIIRMTE